MKSALVIATLAAFPYFAACGSSHTARRYDEVLASTDRRLEVDIEDEAVSACGLDSARTYFSSDSSTLTEDDKLVIGEVAYCITAGKLAGRSILVTGYTDSLGATTDNQDLGWLRSQMVALELHAKGVPSDRIFVHSTGERLAMGDTKDERALERMVELRLLGAHEL